LIASLAALGAEAEGEAANVGLATAQMIDAIERERTGRREDGKGVLLNPLSFPSSRLPVFSLI
jgi:hypothetical protein